MNPDPTSNPLTDALTTNAANKAIEDRVRAWERGMNRAFKGIHPANERRRVLLRRSKSAA